MAFISAGAYEGKPPRTYSRVEVLANAAPKTTTGLGGVIACASTACLFAERKIVATEKSVLANRRLLLDRCCDVAIRQIVLLRKLVQDMSRG